MTVDEDGFQVAAPRPPPAPQRSVGGARRNLSKRQLAFLSPKLGVLNNIPQTVSPGRGRLACVEILMAGRELRSRSRSALRSSGRSFGACTPVGWQIETATPILSLKTPSAWKKQEFKTDALTTYMLYLSSPATTASDSATSGTLVALPNTKSPSAELRSPRTATPISTPSVQASSPPSPSPSSTSGAKRKRVSTAVGCSRSS